MLTVHFCINHLHFIATLPPPFAFTNNTSGQKYSANASNWLKINSLARKDFKAFYEVGNLSSFEMER